MKAYFGHSNDIPKEGMGDNLFCWLTPYSLLQVVSHSVWQWAQCAQLLLATNSSYAPGEPFVQSRRAIGAGKRTIPALLAIHHRRCRVLALGRPTAEVTRPSLRCTSSSNCGNGHLRKRVLGEMGGQICITIEDDVLVNFIRCWRLRKQSFYLMCHDCNAKALCANVRAVV
jgi:hypothetical protein